MFKKGYADGKVNILFIRVGTTEILLIRKGTAMLMLIRIGTAKILPIRNMSSSAEWKDSKGWNGVGNASCACN
jgi:hypothetical protein